MAKGRLWPKEKVYIPDADAVLRQIDLLEKAGPVLGNVLFLESVLSTIRSRSYEVYERVRGLLASHPENLHTAIFSNEHRQETYLERNLTGESEEKYNERLLVHALNWLADHWKVVNIRPVLVVDTTKSSLTGKFEVVATKSIAEGNTVLQELFVEHEEENTMDVDEDASVGKKPYVIFSDYLPERKARAGVKAGRLFQGTFRPSMYNVQEGLTSVSLDPKDRSKRQQVLLIGRENQNRAIDGDVVIIEILPKNEWKGASNLAVEQDDLQEESDDEDVEKNDVVQKDTPPADIIPNGKVVAIAKRNWRPYCGTISSGSFRGGETALFVPIDRSVPKIRIRSHRIREHLGKRLIVVVDKWDRSSAHPRGHIVRAVGSSGDKEAETEVILIENGIPLRKFSKASMECLPDENWAVTEEHIKTRWDFREMDICSVDPPGCTDIDDALHFRRISDSEVEVGVHIADVTAFVAHDSALDREAAERGCTVYLVDRRIEMLPSLLSSKLCSLRSNVERLAFSAIIRLDNDGNVLSSKYGRSVIKSKAALTYQAAQERIDAARKVFGKRPGAPVNPVDSSLLGLAALAKKLRERRMKAGALILASPEVKFKISEVTDAVTDVHLYEVRETNRMVEEFMLLANVVVAERILRQFPQCAMLRRHPRPSEEMFEPLLRAAKAAGFEVDVSNSRKLNDSLSALDATAKKNGDDYLGTLMRIIATRSMTQAVYFSSGEVSDPQYLHYGLASPVYTHFTSPIRRYADVLVHRLLSACLGFSSLPLSLQNSKRMNELAEVINTRHRCAQFASRASSVLHTVLLFRHKTLQEPARITKLLGNGFVVLVPKYGVEGVVHIDEELKPTVDEDMQVMKLADGRAFRVLGNVRVQIRVDTKPERQDRVLYEVV